MLLKVILFNWIRFVVKVFIENNEFSFKINIFDWVGIQPVSIKTSWIKKNSNLKHHYFVLIRN